MSRIVRDPVDLFLVFVPAAIVLGPVHVGAVHVPPVHLPPVSIFLVAALRTIPLVCAMTRATGALSERAGPGIGGLVNVSFGNASELNFLPG